MLKIIHAADFHLDSPFSGLSPQHASQRREEQRELLSRLVEAAAQRQADLLLLAGDLFDGERFFRETGQALIAALGRLTIPVFIAPGNHDFYSARSPYATLDWPENVHIFREEAITSVVLPQLNCTVHGAAFVTPSCSRSLLHGFCAPQDGGTHLMLMHGDTDGGAYNPISVDDIAESGIDYLALGHIHKGGGLQQSGKTRWAYPGCPEGRGFDETGEKGVLYLEIDQGHTSCALIPLQKRRYEIVDVDLSAAETVEAALAAQLPPRHEEDVYRIRFIGEWEGALPLGQLQRKLAPEFFGLELRDATRPPQRLWKRAGEDSLAGYFLEEIMRLYHDQPEDDTLSLAVRFGLAALENGEDVSP